MTTIATLPRRGAPCALRFSFGALPAVLLALAILLVAPSDSRAAALKLKTATPKHGARVTGTITWRVKARPASKVRSVSYLIDGRRVWTDRKAPFRYGRHRGRMNTFNLSNGSHRLKTIARFRGGRRRTSSVRVIVVNGLAASAATVARTRNYAASHLRIDWPVDGRASQARIYRGSLLLATRPAAVGHYTDAMLWFDTTYEYRVELLDAAGGIVSTQGPVRATTAGLPPGGYSPTMAFSSVWATPIAPGHATSPRSGEFVSYITSRTRNANMPTRSYGIPVYEAEENDPRYGPLTCAYGCNIRSEQVPIPAFAAPDPGSDAHMTVIGSDGVTAYDYFKPVKNTSGSWTSTSAGVRYELNGDGVIPKNLGGANAANFANLGGIVRPEEIAQGVIGHALALGIPGIASGAPACPAVKNVGVNGGIIPEGTRFQLDPNLDVASLGLPAWQQTVARALQTYGAYVRDNSGVISIYGETSSATLGGRRYDGWAKAGGGINSGQSSQAFSANFPWGRLRALDFTYC